MKQHLSIWKKVLVLYFAEVLILPLLTILLIGILGDLGRSLFLNIALGFLGILSGEVSAMAGIIPFILNGIFGLLVSRKLDIKWQIFYTVFLGLIIWPLVLLIVGLIGKQFGLLSSY